MTPPALGWTDLATRWGITPQAVDAIAERDGFPEVRRLNKTERRPSGVKYVDQGELEAWEQSLRDADQPLPGERRTRGPDRQPRKRRGSPLAEDGAVGDEL
jgi:hypothetical protein